jgi:hypothetical protein
MLSSGLLPPPMSSGVEPVWLNLLLFAPFLLTGRPLPLRHRGTFSVRRLTRESMALPMGLRTSVVEMDRAMRQSTVAAALWSACLARPDRVHLRRGERGRIGCGSGSWWDGCRRGVGRQRRVGRRRGRRWGRADHPLSARHQRRLPQPRLERSGSRWARGRGGMQQPAAQLARAASRSLGVRHRGCGSRGIRGPRSPRADRLPDGAHPRALHRNRRRPTGLPRRASKRSARAGGPSSSTMSAGWRRAPSAVAATPSRWARCAW